MATVRMQPSFEPQARYTYADPSLESTARNMMASYFGTPDQAGLMSQPIPVPIRQVAGLSPLEIQARNLTRGLGGFGGQLAEAQDLYRRSSQGFNPFTAGIYGDPMARNLYMQSMGQYDPRTGQQFLDQDARSMMRGAAGDIRSAEIGAGQEVRDAQRGMYGGEQMIGESMRGAMPSSYGAMQDIGRASDRALTEAGIGQRGIMDVASRIQPGISESQRGARGATRRARRETGRAGQDLRRAGQLGLSSAREGIGAIRGTGEEFGPSGIGRFMDPYTQQVIDAEQAEIARLGEKQRRDVRSRAVSSGAFGGSREGVEQAEIGRNILEQQARTGAGLRSEGYRDSADRAMQAFEQAQARRQQMGSLMGSLGRGGAEAGISAASRAGELGLSAEELAQRGALSIGELGLSGIGSQADLARQAATMGMSAQELAAQLAGQRAGIGQDFAGMGMQAGRDIGSLAGERGRMGLAGIDALMGGAGQRSDIGAGLASGYLSGQQLGSSVYGDRMGRMAGAAGGLGDLTSQMYGQALDAYGRTGDARRAGAAGIARLGRQGQDMLTGQIGTMSGLGGMGRGIQDTGLGYQYQAAQQMADEPWMRMQRGMKILGQGAPYMPTFQTGYNVGSGPQEYEPYGKFATAARAAAPYFDTIYNQSQQPGATGIPPKQTPDQ